VGFLVVLDIVAHKKAIPLLGIKSWSYNP